MFKTENELVELLKNNITNIISKDNFEILEEVGLGYGVADLLISYIRSPISENYKHEETLNRLDIATYQLISTYVQINIEKILEITRSKKTQQLKSLNKSTLTCSVLDVLSSRRIYHSSAVIDSCIS